MRDSSSTLTNFAYVWVLTVEDKVRQDLNLSYCILMWLAKRPIRLDIIGGNLY